MSDDELEGYGYIPEEWENVDDSDSDDDFDYNYDTGPKYVDASQTVEIYQEPEQQYEMSYAQLDQISYGPATGTFIEGGSKMQQIMYFQTASAEEQYIPKLRQELSQYDLFGSHSKAEEWVERAQQIPRFWFKNIKALSVALYVFAQLEKSNKNLNVDRLIFYSNKYDLRREDLFRYYRLVKQYLQS